MTLSDSSVVWQDAIQFRHCGGWSHDSQFIDLMGFPYLLATGLGEPVEDAVTDVNISRSGRYRLWVRCKDWLPSDSPGQFQVIVGGRASEILFGKASHSLWQWFEGGTFDLASGEIELRLHDLTGWWGRCDALVLSLGDKFYPSNDLQTLYQQRERFGGISHSVERPAAYDVVVSGGGLAGVTAAVSAARHGCHVALLQDRPVLGGNTSAEIQVPALGDETRQPWDPGETGLIEEFDPRATGKSGWSENLEALVKKEPKLDLYLNLRSTGVQMNDDRSIQSIQGMNTRTGQRFHFDGRLFIDCTGDAIIGAAARAEFRYGREARNEFNESLAPIHADRHTMGNTLYGGRIETCNEPVAFETPKWAYQWKSPEDFERRQTSGIWSTGKFPDHFANFEKGKGRPPESEFGPVGCWFVESGGMEDTILDAEFIRDELFRIGIGVWGYVKNYHPKYRKLNANRKLAALNHIAGKRESRRLMGDYVLTQHDYSNRTVHEDTIAYGGWTIDDHHPHGFFAPGPVAYHAYLHKVSIPYRCLYSRNISNLMMAGRNISATHVGFGGVRVMRTCSSMGQAAGTAAAIALRERTIPRRVYEQHIHELQQTLLKDGAYLLGVRNQDPSDLARRAVVTATSVAFGNTQNWLFTPTSKWGAVHQLDTPRAVMFRSWQRQIERVSLALRSRNHESMPLRLTLRAAKELGDFSSIIDLSTAETIVPAHFTGWIDFPLQATTQLDKFYYLALPKTNRMEWELYTHHSPDTLRAFDGPPWGVTWGCYKFRLTPGGEPHPSIYAREHEAYEFAPQSIVDGFNRAVEGNPCSWAPDPTLPLPQHIELCFPEQVRANVAHVTFQLSALAPSAYSIVVRQDGEWRCVARANGNRARRRIHRFNPIVADAVRLIIESRQERSRCPIIPVCEIRLYDEPNTIAQEGAAH
jgi:hypothetical protein